MDSYGKTELLTFYSRRFARFGDSAGAVGWTPGGQQRRYEALLEVAGDLSSAEVLDFGCGKGDLLGYLRDCGFSGRYSGIDVNEELIRLARHKYPGVPFSVLDVEESDLSNSYDVILICGVFNLRIAGIADSLRNVLNLLFPRCRRALHLNIPSLKAPRKDLDLYYADPEELMEFARCLSPSPVLREDLVEDEIFLSLYRQ